MKDILIIAPFNGVFFACLVLSIALTLLAVRRLSGKSMDDRRSFVRGFYIFIIGVYVVYKLLLPLDREYMDIYLKTWGEFTYLNELPFNPCNVALILLPLAVRTMKRPLLCFCFFDGLLGPLLSLVMPITGFSGYSLCSIHVFGYYFTHFAILMAPLLLAGLGLYEPEYRDTLTFAISMVACAAIAYGINVLLRVTELVPSANYFFTIDDESNPVLMLFHKLVPLPFFCVLPGLGILIPASLGITGLCKLLLKRRAREKERSASAV